MTTYETLSLLAQFDLIQIANLTLTVTIVVYSIKKQRELLLVNRK